MIHFKMSAEQIFTLEIAGVILTSKVMSSLEYNSLLSFSVASKPVDSSLLSHIIIFFFPFWFPPDI